MFETIFESFYSINYVNVNNFVKYSTVECKYLLFLQDFFYRLKPKQYKNANIADSLNKNIWKIIKTKQINCQIIDEKLSENNLTD